jgi:asparagine synthase (glutamine-hydrolysing)
MVFRPFVTTVEASSSSQPITTNKLLATFDGRLDNRRDLASRLGHVVTEKSSDVAFLLACYQRWGPACVEALVGDFAFAIWDGNCRSLLLARDPFGVRPLFYNLTKDRIIWASCIDALLAFPDVSRDLDEAYIASYLTADPDGTVTPFKSIHPVKPGYLIAMSDDRLRAYEYCKLRTRYAPLLYKSDLEYEEQFRMLFGEAVKARLRADRPVLALLSGGLDSSSVVCVADEFLGTAENLAPALSSVSFVFDRAVAADERNFVEIMDKRRGRPGMRLLEDDEPMLSTWPDNNFVAFPSPIFCFGGRLRQMLEAMRTNGSRVILAGTYGDNVVTPAGIEGRELNQYLKRGQLFKLFRQAVRWSRAMGRPLTSVLWQAGILPSVPESFKRRGPDVPSWLSKRLAKQKNVLEVLRLTQENPGDRLSPVSVAIGNVSSGHATYETTLGCIEMRYPFLHLPLVSFLLSVPIEQLSRPGETRSLQRRAMRGILPEEIRVRRGKRGPAQALYLALEQQWPRVRELAETSLAAAYGYTDSAELRIEFERARHGLSASPYQLLRFLSFEMWLRNYEKWKLSIDAFKVDSLENLIPLDFISA